MMRIRIRDPEYNLLEPSPDLCIPLQNWRPFYRTLLETNFVSSLVRCGTVLFLIVFVTSKVIGSDGDQNV
jgi:hypothetical protein